MNRKRIALFACIVLCIAVFAGCAQPAPAETSSAAQTEAPSASVSAEATESAEASSAAGGVTVTDMLGSEVTVGKTDKIVSLTPAGTEIVCALGASKQLVGIDASSDYPEITKSIEVVGDFNGPDVEKVAALEPDVVFAGNGLQQEAIDQLKNLGITVVSVEATTFDDISKAIRLVGEVLGAQDEAEAVVGEIDAAVSAAEANKPEGEKTVYYVMSYGDNGNWTSGPGSFMNTMIELAGGKCVTENAEYSWVEYPVEDLVLANPDIILLDTSMGNTAEGLADAQGYQDLDAVKNGNVYEVDANVFTRPGPRIAEAITQISEILNQ